MSHLKYILKLAHNVRAGRHGGNFLAPNLTHPCVPKTWENLETTYYHKTVKQIKQGKSGTLRIYKLFPSTWTTVLLTLKLSTQGTHRLDDYVGDGERWDEAAACDIA